MKQHSKLIITILVVVIAIESWLLYGVLGPVEDNVIPLNNFMYTDLSGSKFSDSLVTVTGSWFSETRLYNPVQSSSIECWKDKGACFEANGSVKDGYLNTSMNTYEIIAWNKKEIIASSSALCTKSTLSIDRVQKSVTLTRKTTNSEGMCGSISKEPILLYLIDGLDAYQKNKSRQ